MPCVVYLVTLVCSVLAVEANPVSEDGGDGGKNMSEHHHAHTESNSTIEQILEEITAHKDSETAHTINKR